HRQNTAPARHHTALQKLREQLYQAKQVVKGNKDVLV
ncbi:hypothetical protein LTSEURB_0503, partial [Salmonella enterica subsp. enterica serovar Urbana str. R8-2977]